MIGEPIKYHNIFIDLHQGVFYFLGQNLDIIFLNIEFCGGITTTSFLRNC